jgi:hypothetical protein
MFEIKKRASCHQEPETVGKWNAVADPRILDKHHSRFKVSNHIFGFVTKIKKKI